MRLPHRSLPPVLSSGPFSPPAPTAPWPGPSGGGVRRPPGRCGWTRRRHRSSPLPGSAPAQPQRQVMGTGDAVGIHPEAPHPRPGCQLLLPEALVPLGESVPAGDGIDRRAEAAGLPVDAARKVGHLVLLETFGGRRSSLALHHSDQLPRLIDDLRPAESWSARSPTQRQAPSALARARASPHLNGAPILKCHRSDRLARPGGRACPAARRAGGAGHGPCSAERTPTESTILLQVAAKAVPCPDDRRRYEHPRI